MGHSIIKDNKRKMCHCLKIAFLSIAVLSSWLDGTTGLRNWLDGVVSVLIKRLDDVASVR